MIKIYVDQNFRLMRQVTKLGINTGWNIHFRQTDFYTFLRRFENIQI